MSEKSPSKIIVTGGAGFIGSAVIRHLMHTTDAQVHNVDKLTYAGNRESLWEIENNNRYEFSHVDICDASSIQKIFETFRPDAIMHLAAESHVDRSIDGPRAFLETNINGTFTLLEAARAYFSSLDDSNKNAFRFHHVSTDEVYGSLGPTGAFTEQSRYEPNSPYSASKASSDHMVRAWHHTYGLPVLITNCSNNYGPYQFPEKLIPVLIRNAIDGKMLPIYGNGENVRDWLYVEDHAEALATVLYKGRIGETYNIGGRAEWTNIGITRAVCALLDELLPDSSHRPHEDLIRFVVDRPGHDQRYAIDADKIEKELGWAPRHGFEEGLRKTVLWYLDNQDWADRAMSNTYQGERLGLSVAANG